MQVAAVIAQARVAHEKWRESSFSKRKQLLRILNKAMLEHADTICKCDSSVLHHTGRNMKLEFQCILRHKYSV